MLPLSVLDLSFVTTATGAAAAIHNSIDLARHVDGLGYRRYWVAEHHNLPSVASGAPEIMIGHIASVTRHMRVGAGGVMLPNHAPLMVAERFKVLEALHPGRIDLGLGRAPGTDRATTWALRYREDPRGGDDFLDRLSELLAWKTGNFPAGHLFGSIRVMPDNVEVPPIWILGSSNYGADVAAALGLPYAFAHHFAQHDAGDAIGRYRANFRPSIWLEQPYAILTVAAVCAPSDEEAARLATTIEINAVRRSHGHYLPLVSPEEAAAFVTTPADEPVLLDTRARVFTGGPERLVERLDTFGKTLGADEIMVVTAIFDHAARKLSYSLLAAASGLSPMD